MARRVTEFGWDEGFLAALLAWDGAVPLTLSFLLDAEMPSLSLKGRGGTQCFPMHSTHGSGWLFGISPENGPLRQAGRAECMAGMIELPYRRRLVGPIYTVMKARGDLAGP